MTINSENVDYVNVNKNKTIETEAESAFYDDGLLKFLLKGALRVISFAQRRDPSRSSFSSNIQ